MAMQDPNQISRSRKPQSSLLGKHGEYLNVAGFSSFLIFSDGPRARLPFTAAGPCCYVNKCSAAPEIRLPVARGGVGGWAGHPPSLSRSFCGRHAATRVWACLCLHGYALVLCRTRSAEQIRWVNMYARTIYKIYAIYYNICIFASI